MSKLTEKKVLKKLGLKDWRGLRKDHYLQLVNMLPQMDVEVAKKCLEMVPELANVVLNATGSIKEFGNNVLTSNEINMQALRAGTMETREILKMQLEMSDLTEDERADLNDKLIEVLRMEYEKDTENKMHGLEVLKKVVEGIAVGVSVISVAIGVGGAMRKTNDYNDNDTAQTLNDRTNKGGNKKHP